MSLEKEEELLWAWMRMSAGVRGNRLLSELSFNEVFICNLLYQNRQTEGQPLTLTDLCEKTRLYKSQVNRTLTALEHKKLICRMPCPQDKRKTYLLLNEDHLSVYLTEHEQVMKIMQQISARMGQEKISQLAELLHEVTDIVDHL